MKRFAAMVCALAFAAGHAGAVLPDEQLKDPKLEARARAIGSELRCVVCQNQTIDDSDADLAHDLRVLLRQRLVAGDSDQQAIDFIVKRYGAFVLMKPPLNDETWLLWLGPALLLAVGGAAVAVYWRGRIAALPPLTDAERAALDQVGRGDAA
jgi:cytochrome c-type biogenesis protein CcmH